MMRRQPQHQQDYQSKIFYELSALVLNIIRSPPSPLDFSDQSSAASQRPPPGRAPLTLHQITPAGFASLLLGISLALMLCGSVTFFIGFILMPWVLGLVVVLYFVGMVSSISMVGRAILCHNSAPSSPTKDVPFDCGDLSRCIYARKLFLEGLTSNTYKKNCYFPRGGDTGSNLLCAVVLKQE